MRGDVSKLLFIDSTVSTDARDHTKIMVPAHPFSAQSGEKQSLTLVSFTMRRNWYNINASNNTFYLYLNNFHYVVTIKPGVYATFAALSAGIGDALTDTIANIPGIQSASTTYLSSNRLFTFEITRTNGYFMDIEIRCFAIKYGAVPTGVSGFGVFFRCA
jgi:hypothetical protein